MKLHEYQSKFRFAEFGIPIPRGKVASSPDEAFQIAKELGGTVVVKAQVLVGGRGKAGGVKLARTPEEAEEYAREILGLEIKGLPVRKVLIDPGVEIETEIYLAVTMDRAARRTVVMASAAGGVDIEEVAATTPEKIIKAHVDPFLGLRDYDCYELAGGIGLPRAHWRNFVKIAKGLYQVYVDSDASLAEINPLVLSKDDQLLALDGKIVLDDNALFRHPQLAEMRDTDTEPAAERQARQAGLSYVKLDGEIGCMVSGAGLAMATMDMIKLFGSEPANFLDIGGGARAERVETALRIILADPNVKGVLFNIFGGITQTDEVARGILAALEEIDTDVPMVARLVGTNQEEGRAILENAGSISTATTLAEAARLAVAAAKGESNT